MSSSQKLKIRLCRGAGRSAIHLQQPKEVASSSSAARPTTVSQLEALLSQKLAAYLPGDDDDGDDETDVVGFAARYDHHWLQCRPSVMPHMTILGIPEDDEGTPATGVQIVHYHPTKNQADDSPTDSSSCQGPHSEWLRSRSGAPTNDLGGKDLSGSPASPPRRNLLQVQWIHLEHLTEHHGGDNIISNPGEAWQFLSSLLGSQHKRNPWVQETKEEDRISSPDVVMVQFPLSTSLNTLLDFRVSDACPSWFFHGYAYMQGDNDERDASSPDSVLFIYKRLPDRIHLSQEHPDIASKNGEVPKLLDGCLWERVILKPQDTGEEDHKSGEGVVGEEEPNPTYRMVSPPYLNLTETYGSRIAEDLFSEEALQIFRSEALAIPQWTPWPETQHYSVGPNGETTWSVFPLCYCFPAHDIAKRSWVEQTRQFCPQTCQRLESVLGDTLRTALFSQLKPETRLEAHTGWKDLANSVLRLHIPLVVPEMCGTWVDGCVETHQAGRPLLFDDSKIHRAFNYSKKGRIVLIVDLARPTSLPPGYATGGHSEELDAFILQMSVPK